MTYRNFNNNKKNKRENNLYLSYKVKTQSGGLRMKLKIK